MKSAVERLQISKADYVKSETVLDNDQRLKWTNHLQITTRPHLDTCVQKLKRNLEKNLLRNCKCVDTHHVKKSEFCLKDNISSNSMPLNRHCCCDMQCFGLLSKNLEMYNRSLPNLSKPKNEFLIFTEKTDLSPEFQNGNQTLISSGYAISDSKLTKNNHSFPFQIDATNPLNSEFSKSYEHIPTKTCNLDSSFFKNYNKLETSVVEKNARIIKWLHSCQKYQENN